MARVSSKVVWAMFSVGLFSPTAGAALLSAGSRSGTVHVDGDGYASGQPSHPFNLTGTVPTAGPGNVGVSGSAKTFGTFGNTIAESSTIDLNSVSGDGYSLDASCDYSYANTGASGSCYPGNMTFSFTQEIVLTTPVRYELTLTASAPAQVAFGNQYAAFLFAKVGFAGPGVSDMAPLPGRDVFDSSADTETYSGILNPGTYTFFGSWAYSGATTIFNSTPSFPLQIAGVTAALSVAPVPEPSAASVASMLFAVVVRRQVRRRIP